MAKLRDLAADNLKRYGTGGTTGDQSLGGAYVDGQGHVNYMAPEDARKKAGFGTLADKLGDVGIYGSMGLLGYGLATGGTGLVGAGAGGSAAAPASGLAADVSSAMAVPGTVGTGAGAGTGMASSGTLGFLSKLKSAGIDPTTLGLGALSMLGGDDDPFQRRQSFGRPNLEGRNDQINQLISQLQSQQPMQQREPIAPVTIPGIPFQIGGGLGTNPALPLESTEKQPTKLRSPQVMARRENWEGDFGSTEDGLEFGFNDGRPYEENAPAPPQMAPAPQPAPTPAPDNNQRVIDEYMAQFGNRGGAGPGPTPQELASEQENLTKYSWDTGPQGGVKAQIDKRATNVPNQDGGSNGGVQLRQPGGGNQSGASSTQAQSAGMDPSKLISTLEGLYNSGGGFNNDIYTKRVSNASDTINRFKKSQMASDKAALASRGLLGEGIGHESGPEATAYGRLGENVADIYGNAITGIQADESANADQRMMQALSLATGMSMADAQNAIEMFKANTTRDLGYGNLALDTELGRGQLDLNRSGQDITRTLGLGNLALGNSTAGNNYNLGRDALASSNENTKMDQIIRLLEQGVTLEEIQAGGYI